MKIGDLLWLLPPLIQKVWKLWNWSFLKSIDKKVKLWQSHQKALASTATAMSWDCKLPKSWHFPLDDKVALEAQWGCSLCQARVGGCWEAEARFTSNVSKSEQAAPQLQSCPLCGNLWLPPPTATTVMRLQSGDTNCGKFQLWPPRKY